MAFRLRFSEKKLETGYRVSAFFEYEHERKEAWFEVPLTQRGYITKLADPFIIGLIFPAMKTGNDLIIEGKNISSGLLNNLALFQKQWHQWKPETYKEIRIIGEEKEVRVIGDYRSIGAFTGGIDSSLVLFKEASSQKNNILKLDTALFVQGFHIPVDHQQDADRIFEQISKISSSLEVKLLMIKTNLRRFGNWHDTHGAAVAASLTLFKENYTHGLIGSSHPLRYLRLPWGSNPLTDPLMSSNNFEIVNYGGQYTRIQKLEQLRNWDAFLENHIVCSVNFHDNCGKCEKCIRTKLGFKALNLPLKNQFVDPSLTFNKIIFLKANLPWEIKDYSFLYHYSKKYRKNSWPFYALYFSILINKGINFLTKNIVGLKIFAFGSYLMHKRKKRRKLYAR